MNNINMKSVLIFLCLLCFQGSLFCEENAHTIIFKNETLTEEPQTLAKKDNLAKKINKLSQLTKANEKQKKEIETVCKYIKDNWNNWVKNHDILDKYSYMRFQVTDKTHITVHPNVPEVCIFLEGHTKTLGQGAFKKAVKALSYVSEEEVAMAIPHQVAHLDFLPYPDANSPFYTSSELTDSEASRELTSSDYPESMLTENGPAKLDYYLDMLVLEVRILEEVQGCAGVIELYFISYHEDPAHNVVPIFVGKYYNGGALFESSHQFKTYSLEESLLICHDLLLGLSELHGRKIAHRDLHGGNILLEKNSGNDKIKGAYISDFGLSMFNAQNYDMQADVSNLKWQLREVLSFQPKAVMALELMDQHLTSKELYTRFVKLLPKMVDKETQKRIMVHAKKKLSPKLKYQNVILWPRTQIEQ